MKVHGVAIPQGCLVRLIKQVLAAADPVPTDVLNRQLADDEEFERAFRARRPQPGALPWERQDQSLKEVASAAVDKLLDRLRADGKVRFVADAMGSSGWVPAMREPAE